MAFKTQRNSVSFGRSATAVKSWVIGWTADQARAQVSRPLGEAKRFSSLGGYGLLAGIGRR